ncbi:hypothetical protein [Brevundimonas goettingensis]|uniref:DUF1499 domain-containing protein n=1 Tax=Brevundimonas goettingensis TaxID=2774190 RepID=A0A975GYK8_9CAUL|nr:hypothetical protein [Brevundimonas goettingensis]QTC91690.1 hypothetical protein IFJ75_01765 [Brevundimonas goettingensis]
MSASPQHDRRTRMFRRARLGVLIAALAPLTAFAALLGFKFNVWSISFALDVLTLKVVPVLAVIGVFGALYAAFAALAERRYAGSLGLAAVVISLLTIGAFGWHYALARDARGGGDVSTNAADSPYYPERVIAARARDHAAPVPALADAGGCEVSFLPTQVAPSVAAYGLDKAGFDIPAAGVGGGSGTLITFWYNRTYDAVVRIRPGRTDVRVTARDPDHDQGKACRLARQILAGMTA